MSKKIAVASKDNMGLNSEISTHFGRCSYYTLVEVEDDEIKKVTCKVPVLVGRFE